MPHDHQHAHGVSADTQRSALKTALILIVAFMLAEVVAGILASSLALLSDSAHMLTDAAALLLSLTAARLATRPAQGSMTYGLGRAEILSAQANGITLLVLALLIVYGGVKRLISPPQVEGAVVLIVAIAGIVVNLLAAPRAGPRVRRAAKPQRRGLLPPHRHRPVRVHRHRGRRGDHPRHRLHPRRRDRLAVHRRR